MLEELLIEGKKKSRKHCYDSVRRDNKAIPFKHCMYCKLSDLKLTI